MVLSRGVETAGQISLIANAPAEINAGLDILDLPFFGENFNADDITSVIAGRDIRYNALGNSQVAAIEIAGPGTLDVQAGRNLNLQTQRINLQGQIGLVPPETGIRTIGNSIDPYSQSAGSAAVHHHILEHKCFAPAIWKSVPAAGGRIGQCAVRCCSGHGSGEFRQPNISIRQMRD